MKAVRQRDNDVELAVRRLLHAAGYRYRVHYPVLKRPRRTADVAFMREKVAIFIDGCFWHRCPDHATWPRSNAEWWRHKIDSNWIRDRDTDARLRDLGWLVSRHWSHESPPAIAEAIARTMLAKRSQIHGIDPAASDNPSRANPQLGLSSGDSSRS